MKKDLSVDSLRGFACLLLVGYHVVGSEPAQGLRVGEDTYLRYLSDSLVYLRMPLFTFLSGYVYALRPLEGDSLAFLLKKVRRLLVPMFVVATLFIGLQMLIPGTNSGYSLHDLYTGNPVAHFWFLWTLMLIFLVLVPLEQSGLSKDRRFFFSFFAGVCMVSLLQFQPTAYFGINGAIYLGPFFLAGVAMHRFGFEHVGTAGKAVVALLALFSIGATQLGLSGIVELNLGRHGIAGFAASMTAVAALFLFRFRSGLLAMIGVFSYSIYLFHVFATAGTRIILERLGLDNLEMHLILGIIVGIGAPIILEKCADHFDTLRVLLLGKRIRGAGPLRYFPLPAGRSS